MGHAQGAAESGTVRPTQLSESAGSSAPARAKPEPSQGWHDVRGATLTPIPHRCQQRPRRTRAPTPCTERGRVYVCVVSRSIKQGIKIAPGRSRRACVLGVLGQLGPQLLQGRANGSDPRDEAHDHVKTWSRCGAPATGGASVHARLLLRPSTCGGGACPAVFGPACPGRSFALRPPRASGCRRGQSRCPQPHAPSSYRSCARGAKGCRRSHRVAGARP